MRIKRKLYRVGGHPCVYMERWTETYTLRQDLPDGTVLRSDGKCLWSANGTSWKGMPPKKWDDSKAVKDDYVTSFELEGDYS